MIANELGSIHGHQDAAHSSSQATDSAKGTIDSAREQTASAVDYVEEQLKQTTDQVHWTCKIDQSHTSASLCCVVMLILMVMVQEDPEVKEFKAAAADTAEDVKKSVQPNDKTAGSDKTVLEQVRERRGTCSTAPSCYVQCCSVLSAPCMLITSIFYKLSSTFV